MGAIDDGEEEVDNEEHDKVDGWVGAQTEDEDKIDEFDGEVAK